MTEIETMVREMLERRAADVDHITEPSRLSRQQSPAPLYREGETRSKDRRRAAAVLVVLALSTALAIVLANTAPRGRDVADVATLTEPTTTTVTTTAPTSLPESVTATGQALGTRTLNEVVAELPVGVNLVDGPQIFTGATGQSLEAAALDYLSQRMPGLESAVAEADRVGDLVVLRWSNADPEEQFGGFAGSLIARQRYGGVEIVAATTDVVNVRDAARTVGRLTATIRGNGESLLAADVLELGGSVVADAPNPKGFNAGAGPLFGTAGSTDSDLLELDLATQPRPVVVRVQHLGGTMLSITEFVLLPVGFDTVCGSQPPVHISVGKQLDGIQTGASPHSSTALLTNQSGWYFSNNSTSLEIRWPASPNLISRIDPAVLTQSPSIGSTIAGFPRAALFLGGEPSDPCAFVQVTTFATPMVAEWWTGAISSEWSFGLPLTIADLDPADLTPAPADLEPPTQLVVGAVDDVAVPVIPQSGSCDGDPGAEPRTGPGTGIIADTARDALRQFVATASTDPPLPIVGYTGGNS